MVTELLGSSQASTSPGPWVIRELTNVGDVAQAALDARAWGFTRLIQSDEIDLGTWFRMGQGGVFWFEAPHPAAPGAAFVHCAVDPECRGWLPTDRWNVAIQIIAELMGSTYIVAATLTSEVRDYALALGWVEDGPLIVLSLGGVHGLKCRFDSWDIGCRHANGKPSRIPEATT